MRTFIISGFVVLGLSGFGYSTAHSAPVQQVQLKLVLPGGNDCDERCRDHRREEEARREQRHDEYREERREDERHDVPPPDRRY
jgi:hypothetical protein